MLTRDEDGVQREVFAVVAKLLADVDGATSRVVEGVDSRTAQGMPERLPRLLYHQMGQMVSRLHNQVDADPQKRSKNQYIRVGRRSKGKSLRLQSFQRRARRSSFNCLIVHHIDHNGDTHSILNSDAGQGRRRE
jgi:hypothetical protein